MSSAADTAGRPRIAHGFRLQWEPAQDAHVLLYPEGMIKLNPSAAAIMSRCDGVRTVAEIIRDIETSYALSGLTGDVTAFVALAVDKGWLEVRA